jgi:hypothetical protein
MLHTLLSIGPYLARRRAKLLDVNRSSWNLILIDRDKTTASRHFRTGGD